MIQPIHCAASKQASKQEEEEVVVIERQRREERKERTGEERVGGYVVALHILYCAFFSYLLAGLVEFSQANDTTPSTYFGPL